MFNLLCLQGYYHAYAGIALPNPASVGLHEAVGFQLVGVYRQVGYKCATWHDVAWYQRELQPLPREPLPPKALREAQLLREWQPALMSGWALLRTGERGQ